LERRAVRGIWGTGEYKGLSGEEVKIWEKRYCKVHVIATHENLIEKFRRGRTLRTNMQGGKNGTQDPRAGRTK